MRKGLACALAAGAGLAALSPSAGAYRAGPPVGHSGGFGEPTCAVCHWGDGPSQVPGDLVLKVPARYQPGQSYDIVVVLRDPDLGAAGFQLTARFADGADSGSQAGALSAPDAAVMVVTSDAGISYAGHTSTGSSPAQAGRATWVVRWTAPPEGGTVAFHAAANAANDDDSELGDRIHLTEALSYRR